MQGIIDIGSNTMRLSMYDTANSNIDLLFSKKIMASLASYIDGDNNLTQAGIDSAVEALLVYRNLVEKLGDPSVAVIATASLRNIDNTHEVIAAIKKATDFTVTLLSGAQEAHYDFEAARKHVKSCMDADDDEFLVVDIGGGSTELAWCETDDMHDGVSFPVGSLNQYMHHVDYLIPTKQNRHAIYRAMSERIKDHWAENVPSASVLVGIGGSVRYALRLYNAYFKQAGDNRIIEATHLKELIKSLAPAEKRSVVRLTRTAPERIHTLVPGMVILRAVADAVGAQTIIVSDWGVREGYLMHLLEQERNHG